MRRRRRRIRSRVLLLCATVIAGVPSLATAGEWVRFHDGRFLKVQGHERLEGAVRLRLPGGAWVLLPESRIEGIEPEREGAGAVTRPRVPAGHAVAWRERTGAAPAGARAPQGRPPQGAAKLVAEKADHSREILDTIGIAARRSR